MANKKIARRKNRKHKKKLIKRVDFVDPNYELQDVIDTVNFDEVDDIVELSEISDELDGIDAKTVRERLIELAQAKAGVNYENWGPALSSKEKEELVKWFAAPKVLRDTVFTTDDQQFEFGRKFFIKKSRAARQRRFDAILSDIFSSIKEKLDKLEIVQDIMHCEIAKINDAPNTVIVNLHDYYITFGAEGTEMGDGEGVYDYIDGTAGTTFENGGLRGKTSMVLENYNGSPQTMAELCDRVMGKIRTGKFS